MEATVEQLAENCIERLQTCRSYAQDGKSRAALQNRLADFYLWCDGVGARAGPRASLDRRFQSRPDDLVMIKGMLILLHQFLTNYSELLRCAQGTDDALRNVDSALENLALLAMAIRQTGKKARLEKADSRYDPNDYHLLRDHLEFIIRIHRDSTKSDSTQDDPVGYKSTCLDWRQYRLVDANLRRRNRFIQAQKHHKHLKSRPTADTTVGPHQHEPRVSHNIQNESTTPPALQKQRSPTAKSPNARENTVSGTSASAPDSTMNLDFRQLKRPSPAIDVPRTIITKVNASTSYPCIKVPPGQQSFQCPCCCQTLTREYAADDNLWRKHLANDVSPYTCIAEKCPSPFVFYNTTADLEHHIGNDHPRTWQCPLCDDFPPVFVREEYMESHIRMNHMEVGSEEMPGLLSMALQYGFGIKVCPLCGEFDDIVDSPELIAHVLEHMHSFSLLSLPWAVETSDANSGKDLWFNPSSPSLLSKPRDAKKINITATSEPLTAIERLMPWLESDAVATVHDIADTQKSRWKIKHEPVDDNPDFFSNQLYFADQSTNASASTQEEFIPPASSSRIQTPFYDNNETTKAIESLKSELSSLLPLDNNATIVVSEFIAKIQSIETDLQAFNPMDDDEVLLTLNKIRIAIDEFRAAPHIDPMSNLSANPSLPSLFEEIKSGLHNLQLASQQSRNRVSNLKAARNPPLFPEHLRYRDSNVSTTHNQLHSKTHKSLKVRLRQAFVTTPTDGRRFIPCRQLSEICDELTVAQELSKAFPGFDDSLYQSRASLICRGQTQDSIISQPCLKIFVILVLLGHAHLIESFMQHPLCDEDLPFLSTPDPPGLYSPQHNPESSLTFPDEDDQYEIIEEFLEKQWSVLIPSFEAPKAGNMSCNVYELHDKTILPIQEVSRKKYPGGFGLVEKVKIHREHNGFNHEYFALKTMYPMIPDERDRFFQQELDAFQKAKPSNHVIEIDAAFKKGESRGFLFPWAEGGTLNHLWAKDPHKIVSDAGVQWSEFSRWICTQCHGLIQAVRAIHAPSSKPAGTSAEDLYGIHSDIKPDNILHFTDDGPPLGLLKVSDLGLVKFHRLVSRTVQSKSMGNAYQTYRAPEHDMGRVRSRKIDIWAFGCLFAEFVTWAIGGENAIELFKTARIDEDKRFPDENKGEWAEDNFFIMKTSRLTQVKAPKRKGTVDEWFSDLTKDLGPDMANTFFPQFLRFIQSSMLDPDRKHRADSKQVETFLGRVLQQNPPDSPYWHFNGTVEYPKTYSRSTTGTGTW